jgi:hypothetical protein
MDIPMKSPILWFLSGMAILYFGAVFYAIYRGKNVKASLKVPFALFSFETSAPAGRDRGLIKGRSD